MFRIAPFGKVRAEGNTLRRDLQKVSSSYQSGNRKMSTMKSGVVTIVAAAALLLGCGEKKTTSPEVGEESVPPTSQGNTDSPIENPEGVPEVSPPDTPEKLADWNPESVPVLAIPANDGDWSPFYRDFEFSLAADQYRNDPALATLVFREYLERSSIEWREMVGDEEVERKHEISPSQNAWLKEAFNTVRPLGVSYCQWMQQRAVEMKDVRTAMAATLLWIKLKHLQEPGDEEADAAEEQIERLQQILKFLGEEESSQSLSLLREEIQGKLEAEQQWTIENVQVTWEAAYSKSFGLSTLRVSPPEETKFLRVRATVRNSGSPVVDAWSLPLFQDSPRNFPLRSSTNWWMSDVELYQDVPPELVEPRRLLSPDMVHLVSGNKVDPSDGATFMPAGVIPCHVVGDECDALLGSQASAMLMLLALSGKAANPAMIASGSWVGQGGELQLDVYFAVTESEDFDYSLYLMGNTPLKISQPE